MNDYQDKDGSGHLFKNKRKLKDTHPDFQGHCVINGKKWELSAWTKVKTRGDDIGEKFLSISISEPWKPDPSKRKPRIESEEVF